MIAESIKVQGKRRVEIRQRLFRHASEPSFDYTVETWLFFPSRLQINPQTYAPRQFVQGLKNYIRFRTPVMGMDTLAAPGGLLDRVHTLLEDLPDAPSIQAASDAGQASDITPEQLATAEQCELELKHFCLAYKRRMHRIKRRIGQLESPERRTQRGLELAHAAVHTLQAFRALTPMAAQLEYCLKAPVFAYCDEYLSIVTSRNLFEVLQSLPPSTETEAVRALWRGQAAYRDEHYPDSVPVEGEDNELPIYRWSVLKKYVDMPLFLEVHTKLGGNPLVGHVLTSIAGAVAMIAATALAFAWQHRYGDIGAPLFIALVVTYIFRDRLKDFNQQMLFRRFRRWLPDRRMFIYNHSAKPVGRCREYFSFIPESRLPDDVRTLRERSHLVNVANSFTEDILSYARHVHVDSVRYPFGGTAHSIVDITRFDVTDFLRHADDLSDALPSADTEVMVPGTKVYHINMLRKTTQAHRVKLERYRLVLTHDGIKRIETVRQQTGQLPD